MNGPGSPAAAPPPPLPPAPPVNPADSVKAPAIIMIVLAGLGGAVSALFLVLNILGVAVGSTSAMQDERIAQYVSGGCGIAFLAASIVLDVLVLLGGMKMLKLQSWGLALAAAIVCLVPCYWSCCGLGLIPGIWGLIVLLKPEVKAAFR